MNFVKSENRTNLFYKEKTDLQLLTKIDYGILREPIDYLFLRSINPFILNRNGALRVLSTNSLI
jgi:hypothetical protein